MKEKMKISELLDIIKNNNIAIYGAGYAAQNFYTALQIQNLNKQVKCFVVTDPNRAQGEMLGIPIRTVNDIVNEEHTYVCIAVHEAIKKEIEEYLLKFNIYKYVWVHPYIMEIALGSPLEYHKLVEIRKIMQQHCYDNYAFAIRYLAIENYYNKNTIGYEIYLKALNLQCEPQTARKRLNNFIKLISDWNRNGYQQEQEILIDEKYRLIDGTHRISLACYHKLKYVFCNVFPYSDNYNSVIKESHFLSMEALKKNGFNLYELEKLKKVQKKIFEV